MEAQLDYAVHPASQERVKEIAAGIFQTDAASIDLAMGPDDIDRWDSLNHLRLITEVENAFSVRLTMQQIQQIHSLADLVRFVAEGNR
jgi:acyl carrier protein